MGYKEDNARYRLKNKAKIAAHMAKKAAERRLLLNGLKNRPCMDCGARFPPECMDFDHRDPETKHTEVGLMLTWKWERVLAEIALCDLVCSNCHRIRTFK
jgi:hypothetical protein